MTTDTSEPGDAPDSPPAGFERQSAAVNGTALSYLIGGSGPLVVLLHGWPQTSACWRPVLPPLASSGYTVLAPDLRGLGQSEHAAGGYGKDEQVGDMQALVRHLGLGPQVNVVGHDIGGMVAFAWARLRPAEVRTLTLVDLALPGLGLEQAMDVAKGGMFHFGLFMTPDVPDMLIDGHEDEFFPWWFDSQMGAPGAIPQTSIDTTIRAYRGRPALHASFGHYRTLLDDGKVTDAWVQDGGHLSMPVLALGGEHSAGERLAQSLQQLAPHLQGQAVEGAGHFVAEEQPARFLDVLQPFLAAPATTTTT